MLEIMFAYTFCNVLFRYYKIVFLTILALYLYMFIGHMDNSTTLTEPIPKEFFTWLKKDSFVPKYSSASDSFRVDYLLSVPVRNADFDQVKSFINSISAAFVNSTRISYSVFLPLFGQNVQQLEAVARQLSNTFRHLTESGKLLIVVPKQNLFEQNLNECGKTNLAFAYSMLYARYKCSYYLQLDSDVKIKDNLLQEVDGFRLVAADLPWLMLEFSTVAFLGKLFRSKDLFSLAGLFVKHHVVCNSNNILDFFIDSKHGKCRDKLTAKCYQELGISRLLHRPSLVYYTNNKYKRDMNFPIRFEPWPWTKVPVYINPSAEITTDCTPYDTHDAQDVYTLNGPFLCRSMRNNDAITWTFTTPTALEEFFIRTMHDSYPGVYFNTDTYIEVLPLMPEKVNLTQHGGHFQLHKRSDLWITVGRFNNRGIAQGALGSVFGKLRALRIRVQKAENRDVLLREVVLKVMVVDTDNKPCCEPFWPDPFPNGIPSAVLFNKVDL